MQSEQIFHIGKHSFVCMKSRFTKLNIEHDIYNFIFQTDIQNATTTGAISKTSFKQRSLPIEWKYSVTKNKKSFVVLGSTVSHIWDISTNRTIIGAGGQDPVFYNKDHQFKKFNIAIRLSFKQLFYINGFTLYPQLDYFLLKNFFFSEIRKGWLLNYGFNS